MQRKTIDIDDDGVVFNDKTVNYTIFSNDKGYLFRQRNHSRKSYSDIRLSQLINNDTDFMRVHLLAEHIYKDTNIIMVQESRRKIRVADIEDIANIIKLSPKKSREFINRVKKLHVIAERIDHVGDIVAVKFVLNPLFFNSNKYLSADLYFLFQESLDCYLPSWVIKKFHEIANIKK